MSIKPALIVVLSVILAATVAGWKWGGKPSKSVQPTPSAWTSNLGK